MARAWYFAYGSNMQSATFRRRRGIQPARALAARIAGWRLVFDKPPLVPVRESFANIVPEPRGEVFGVLYEISEEDLAHIDLTEGVLIGNYRRISIRCEPLSGADAVAAHTLTSERRDPRLKPSTRYLRCLLDGAREHRLPESYVTWLESVSARPSSREAIEMRDFIDAAMKRPRAR